ncbi:UDP-arabinose 4-epimerase 1-like isoform X2 [Rutidosis leptorrhynchoides]|uniref:UDP-arabinose 4-epimerase 1-like isoform X2 n=1 Tax=Rutidosis leptorrhynchoides TaxID=125765 RepID=UPI003A98F2AC
MNFNKPRSQPRPTRSYALGGVDHTEPIKKKGFVRKIALATTLIVLCIFMLKQSPSFRTPSPFSQHETGIIHVLVTGGAGYIGSHATLRLLKDSYRLTIVDNLSRGSIGAVRVLIFKTYFQNLGDFNSFTLIWEMQNPYPFKH